MFFKTKSLKEFNEKHFYCCENCENKFSID